MSILNLILMYLMIQLFEGEFIKLIITGENFEEVYLGIDGEPIERTPVDYPYSYDFHYIWGVSHTSEKEENLHSVYSDRLYQLDYKKYNKLM